MGARNWEDTSDDFKSDLTRLDHKDSTRAHVTCNTHMGGGGGGGGGVTLRRKFSLPTKVFPPQKKVFLH